VKDAMRAYDSFNAFESFLRNPTETSPSTGQGECLRKLLTVAEVRPAQVRKIPTWTMARNVDCLSVLSS
jgi:hypothetical protein